MTMRAYILPENSGLLSRTWQRTRPGLGWTVVCKLGAVIGRRIESDRARRGRRHAARELHGLSDHLLADIGLMRAGGGRLQRVDSCRFAGSSRRSTGAGRAGTGQ